MNNKIEKVVVEILIVSFLTILLMILCPKSLDYEKTKAYYTICVQIPIFLLIHLIVNKGTKIDIFSPLLLLTIIHLLLFEITPIICLLNGDILWFDLDLWRGSIKGTWYSTIGFLSLYISYFYWSNNRNLNNKNKEHINETADYTNKGNLLYINLIIWSFAFLMHIIYLFNTGKGLMYILTLGVSDSSDVQESNSSLLFLGIIAYAMLPSYLYIFFLSKSRVLKIVLFYLMITTFIMRGFRFIIVAIIISPIIVMFLKKHSRPKLLHILAVLIILLLMIGFVGSTRTELRNGQGVKENINQSMTIESITYTVTDNFSIFKTYYGIIEHIPKDMNYTLGEQIVKYTIIMFVPRAIWSNKPQPIIREILSTSVSPYASIAGTAYPYIGEYYHEFGLLGIIVFCFFLGQFCKRINYLKEEKDIHSIVLFATLYPLLFQILIRGYTPSNFYMILFVILPVYISKKLIPK